MVQRDPDSEYQIAEGDVRSLRGACYHENRSPELNPET